MRNWPQTQAQASFKGVNFEVDTDKIIGGRRIVKHEYPGSEFWDNEDLGRSVATLKIEGYVHGDDADDQAQRLFAACNSPGSGLLVLPLRPQQKVRCETVESTFEADAMGRMPFTMQFVADARAPGGIVSSVMFAGAVSNAADTAAGNRVADFSSSFNSVYRGFSAIVAVPGCARTAAAATIALAAAALATARAAVTIEDPTSGAEVDYACRYLTQNALSIAFQGSSAYRIDELAFVDDQTDEASPFARIFTDAVQLLTNSASNPADVVAALQPLTIFQPQLIGVPVGYIPMSVRAELALTGEVATLVRQISLIYWAKAVSFVPYTSREDAVTARAMLAPAFKDEIAAAADNSAADDLGSVMNSAAQFLSRNGAQLPQTVQVTTARGLPAAVVAALLYNDASRDADLWLRNDPENHPLEMPTVIEALAPQTSS